MKTLIKNAITVFPDEMVKANILIEDQTIVSIDAADHTTADEVINANGFHLLPGVIDDQVHFRDPGLTHKEDLYTGSRACAKGGVTTFLEMPNTNPTTTSVSRLAEKLAVASEKCLVNFGFYIGATSTNVEELQNASRTPGIKIFIGSSTGDLLVDEQEALERIFAETTLPVCAHCEDESTIQANKAAIGKIKSIADHSRIRDHKAALIATKRATDLAKKYQHRFHVLHVSTSAEIEVIRDHQNVISAEVCPHHLFFNTNDYERLGSLVQMNPSIKFESDNKQLWQALLDGDIQVVATDHAPHTLEEKSVAYPKSPSGLPAVENSLALMLNQVHLGLCNLQQVVQWMCVAPAKVWDIQKKGSIQVGYDADLVLVDLNKSSRIENDQQETKSKWSPWNGTTLTGWPVRTWVMGHEVFRDGKFDESRRGQEAEYDHALGGYWS